MDQPAPRHGGNVPEFQYEAQNRLGMTERGHIHAADEQEGRSLLRSRGLRPVCVWQWRVPPGDVDQWYMPSGLSRKVEDGGECVYSTSRALRALLGAVVVGAGALTVIKGEPVSGWIVGVAAMAIGLWYGGHKVTVRAKQAPPFLSLARSWGPLVLRQEGLSGADAGTVLLGPQGAGNFHWEFIVSIDRRDGAPLQIDRSSDVSAERDLAAALADHLGLDVAERLAPEALRWAQTARVVRGRSLVVFLVTAALIGYVVWLCLP
jgi:hypothetical protein